MLKKIIYIIIQCTWGLGPFYIFVGIISVAWGSLPYFAKLRQEKNLPYTACFVEAWASKWGELVTKEKAVWE